MTDAPLKLFNSLTRQTEVFESVHLGEARVYTCGPTVYNYPHIGNMRAYVFADVLAPTFGAPQFDANRGADHQDFSPRLDPQKAAEAFGDGQAASSGDRDCLMPCRQQAADHLHALGSPFEPASADFAPQQLDAGVEPGPPLGGVPEAEAAGPLLGEGAGSGFVC